MRFLCMLLALVCLACERSQDAQPEAFQVGLLTPGSIRDAGWNQSAYEGLLRVREELGAEIAHQVTRTPQQVEEGFRDLAARGFELVFGHGFEFQDAAAKVGREYPDTVFITTSGSTVRPNVSPIVFELEQATYVLGYVGASISRRARLAAVGGVKVPSVASTFMAFEAGARAARSTVRVSVSYIGSWTDVSAAREATLAAIAEGVDVLIHNLNEAAHGFFQAVRESEGVLAFGANRNQNALAPEHVLASATIDIPQALLLVAREVESGSFQPRSIRFGLRDGVIQIEWNEGLLARVPADVKREADALVTRIKEGALEVPRAGF
ncbi:MAG: BMP family protein [Myxococcales bacterium]|nr:BMP family protein [Myxococcales bacterium]TDI99179.1 MAG: BMP family ABC transporter substrate-binding protein [Deltaproteobacteria bacterium]